MRPPSWRKAQSSEPGRRTVICSFAVELELAIEVAVTIGFSSLVTCVGALYVTDLAVLLLSLPTPERLQFTPELLESFETVAVISSSCPAKSVCGQAGLNETVTGALDSAPTRSHPTPPPIVANKAKMMSLRRLFFLPCYERS